MDLEKLIALNISVKLSEKVSKRITNQTERHLQSFCDDMVTIKHLKNIWDDVCYKFQKEGSCGMVYEIMIREHVSSLVEDLEDYEFNAIYLQAESSHMDLFSKNSSMAAGVDKHSSIGIRFFTDEVVRYITEEYIYKRAKNYTNKGLRRAIANFIEVENS
ncbi:hypothetical protein [Psychrobacter sp. JCM 18900]|uniref:hypothetical protein n=1 Tax=Psychrobacter sp. JCM 18900 TaxID=1298608 RepID=UPI00191B1545|nr:hypothetical protein [Psychrobacter sp. JCM 18900]